MSFVFRIVLILLSVLTMVFAIRKIRKSQMEIADSLFWLILSLGLVVMSIFPQIPIFFARMLGFLSEANFVYISVIFVIILKLFALSIEVSQLKSKLRKVIQEYAILKNAKDKEDKESLRDNDLGKR